MWPRDPGVTATSQITSNLLALNNNMDLAHKPAVWAGLLGTSLSAPLGVSWEGSKAGGWNHFSAHSLTCLVVDAGFGWALIWETVRVAWASSQHGKWAQRAYPGTERERESKLAPGKRCILVSDRGLQAIQRPFRHILLVAQNPAGVQEENRSLPLNREWQSWNYFCGYFLGNTTCHTQ